MVLCDDHCVVEAGVARAVEFVVSVCDDGEPEVIMVGDELPTMRRVSIDELFEVLD